jgi:prepilin-type N-terminal cleavage/methylation domain-containing protein
MKRNETKKTGFIPEKVVHPVMGGFSNEAKERNSLMGFTLIELITAVVIIAVITVAGLVSFSSISSRHVEAEARKLVADMNWIRERAASTHTYHAIYLENGKNFYELYERPPGALNLLDRVVLESTLNLIYANQYIYFSPQGNTNISQPSEPIILKKGNSAKEVDVFRDTGYVKVK